MASHTSDLAQGRLGLDETSLRWACLVAIHNSVLSLPKFLGSLHFLKSILTTSLHVLFRLPLLLGDQSTFIEKLVLNSVVAGLHWTFPYHLKQVDINFSPIDATP